MKLLRRKPVSKGIVRVNTSALKWVEVHGTWQKNKLDGTVKKKGLPLEATWRFKIPRYHVDFICNYEPTKRRVLNPYGGGTGPIKIDNRWTFTVRIMKYRPAGRKTWTKWDGLAIHGSTFVKNMQELGLPWVIMKDFMKWENTNTGLEELAVSHSFNGTWEKCISESKWLETCSIILSTFNAWTMEQLIEEKDTRVKDAQNRSALKGVDEYFEQMKRFDSPFDSSPFKMKDYYDYPGANGMFGRRGYGTKEDDWWKVRTGNYRCKYQSNREGDFVAYFIHTGEKRLAI